MFLNVVGVKVAVVLVGIPLWIPSNDASCKLNREKEYKNIAHKFVCSWNFFFLCLLLGLGTFLQLKWNGNKLMLFFILHGNKEQWNRDRDREVIVSCMKGTVRCRRQPWLCTQHGRMTWTMHLLMSISLSYSVNWGVHGPLGIACTTLSISPSGHLEGQPTTEKYQNNCWRQKWD